MKTPITEPTSSPPGEMKMFVDIQKIYHYREPVDFCKAIDG